VSCLSGMQEELESCRCYCLSSLLILVLLANCFLYCDAALLMLMEELFVDL
jgi:hypothetical protein